VNGVHLVARVAQQLLLSEVEILLERGQVAGLRGVQLLQETLQLRRVLALDLKRALAGVAEKGVLSNLSL